MYRSKARKYSPVDSVPWRLGAQSGFWGQILSQRCPFEMIHFWYSQTKRGCSNTAYSTHWCKLGEGSEDHPRAEGNGMNDFRGGTVASEPRHTKCPCQTPRLSSGGLDMNNGP